MALTSAVANAAAAAAAGAGKKAAQVQLQAELNSDDDWNKFIARDGLLVVDVYTEWCGPCLGMVGNLKKIKVELGGDNLHLAVGGQLLNVVFGANAPLLARSIEEELRNEEQVRAGQRSRPQRAPHQLTPREQEKANEQARREEERLAREAAAAAAAREARREGRARRLELHFNDVCPVLLLPHAQKNLRKVTDALELFGLTLADKCPVVLGAEAARVLAAEQPELGSPGAAAALAERPSMALLVRRNPDREGDVISLTLQALCGGEERGVGEGLRRVPADELRQADVPGLLVPADRHQRAAVLDLLFPKLVSTCVSPPPVAEPPRVAMVFGAWQRRAVLAAAARPARLLRYGFFENASVEEPKLLCKTVEQYEMRPEKDYAETIVLSIAVGLAEPLLAPPEPPPAGVPPGLLALGPLHVSEDAVAGAAECDAFFPPGYSEPERKPKHKGKKKKKKRQEAKEETVESVAEPAADGSDEAGGGGAAEGAEGGEGDGRDSDAEDDSDASRNGDKGERGEVDKAAVDKATSPPPLTPH